MPKPDQHNLEADQRALRVLEELEANPQISQRDLSVRLGVALGITNSLIKTLARKGLIKVRGNNNRSITYHLTKAGLLHKSRLALEWTLNTISDYRRMRRSVEVVLAAIASRGAHSVVLCGANELAEIAAVVAPETGVRIIGVADGDSKRATLAGYPVTDLETLLAQKPDALVSCYPDRKATRALADRGDVDGLPIYNLLDG